VDNNYLDLGMNKSGFVHTLPSGRLTRTTVSTLPGRPGPSDPAILRLLRPSISLEAW
jgi:hypothetical protein